MTAASSKTYLVTGAGGFVGSHVVRTALATGNHVVALLHRPETASAARCDERIYAQKRKLLALPHAAQRLTLTEGCLLSAAALSTLFEQSEIDSVIHLAGVTRVAEASRNRAAALEVNVEGTRRLAQATAACARRRGGPLQFVLASTVRVFEGLAYESLDVYAPKSPRSAYAYSKMLAEEALLAFPELDVLITYAPNFFGLGESSTVIPIWIDNALHGLPIEIWGDSSVEVSFTRVEPYCSQLLSFLAREPARGRIERRIELGDYRISLRDLAEVICAVLDRCAPGERARTQGGSFRDLIRLAAS
jgi:nucleoside-diphosphate-sugar epimerase